MGGLLKPPRRRPGDLWRGYRPPACRLCVLRRHGRSSHTNPTRQRGERPQTRALGAFSRVFCWERGLARHSWGLAGGAGGDPSHPRAGPPRPGVAGVAARRAKPPGVPAPRSSREKSATSKLTRRVRMSQLANLPCRGNTVIGAFLRPETTPTVSVVQGAGSHWGSVSPTHSPRTSSGASPPGVATILILKTRGIADICHVINSGSTVS